MRQTIDKARVATRHRNKLGDFTADRRVLLLIGMALVVGGASTGTAWILLKLIALVTDLVWFGQLSVKNLVIAHTTRSAMWMVLAPAAGGLVIGLMARFGSEKIRGHGIPEAIEAILLGGSRMQPKVAVLKPLSSAISIGSGGPFGAEGPIIMTGGAVGSLFAQCFRLTAAERKTLLVAGAAAGMTAIFGTPIAAVLLAVELLLFEWKPRSFLPVVAASIVSEICRPFLFGSGPLFPFTEHPNMPMWGMAAAIGVGVVAGLQSGLMTRLLYAAEDLFDSLPLHWMWWPMLGGLVVGAGGAGTAIAHAVAEEGAASITVVERDQMRQRALIGDLQRHYPALAVHDRLPPEQAIAAPSRAFMDASSPKSPRQVCRRRVSSCRAYSCVMPMAPWAWCAARAASPALRLATDLVTTISKEAAPCSAAAPARSTESAVKAGACASSTIWACTD